MPISYDKLWKLLIDKKMNRTDLKDASGISFNVLAKMGKNEPMQRIAVKPSASKPCTTLGMQRSLRITERQQTVQTIGIA